MRSMRWWTPGDQRLPQILTDKLIIGFRRRSRTRSGGPIGCRRVLSLADSDHFVTIDFFDHAPKGEEQDFGLSDGTVEINLA